MNQSFRSSELVQPSKVSGRCKELLGFGRFQKQGILLVSNRVFRSGYDYIFGKSFTTI